MQQLIEQANDNVDKHISEWMGTTGRRKYIEQNRSEQNRTTESNGVASARPLTWKEITVVIPLGLHKYWTGSTSTVLE